MPDGGPHRAVILTAIRIEYLAVRAHLTNLRQEIHPLGTVYERGDFTVSGQTWDVLIVQTGAGNANAAVETIHAIDYFKPSLVFFVGVAGGLKDVKLGDVVAATKVYGYESGKAEAIFQTRPDVYTSTYRMKRRAQAEANKEDWLQRLIGPIPDPAPQVYVAPIASGDQVIASTDSAVWNLLRASYGDALTVEMEGYGFLRAVHAYPQIDALIIRGISDLVDSKSEADAAHSQEIAARHASAFAFEVLAKLDADEFHQGGKEAKTPAPHQGQQENEPKEQKIIPQGKTEVLSSAATTNSLQEFRAAFPGYCEEIRMAFVPFDSGQDIYQDQCDSVIEALDSLYKHMQKLSRDASAFDLVVECDLDNIQDDVSKLKVELQKFRSLCPPKRTPTGQRLYNIAHNRICTRTNSLLESLTQLNIRLAKIQTLSNNQI